MGATRSGLCTIASVGLLALLVPRVGYADEPVAAREPQLMSETAEITSVADAFDKNDPFDLNLVVGFTQSWKNAKIRRESNLNQPGLASGNFVPATANIASYSSTMSTLLVGADVGIYRDLALILRLPIILSWGQALDDLNGSAAVAPAFLQDPQGGSLFSIPFKSPNRSGIDYVSAGLDWAISNQQRDETKPTWVIGIEGRLAVGSPLHACNANAPAGTPQCPDPSDVANPQKNRDAGISRGMHSVIGKTIWSRRFGYVEPYSGFFVQADFPTGDSDFGKWNPTQNLERTPPLQGTFALGLEVIPYERREQFQRLSADFRFKGTYHSPGREYSELFDALGSSQAASLRTPNPSSWMANPDPATAGRVPSVPGVPGMPGATPQDIYFTGVTEQQAYGSFGLSASATWQAGQYIKFTAGTAFTYSQPHLVTAADTCNPNVGTPEQSGPCRSTVPGAAQVIQGVPNPDHHDVIDLPGHRFSVDDTTVVDLYIMGIVMF
jgi:hypothetical protein